MQSPGLARVGALLPEVYMGRERKQLADLGEWGCLERAMTGMWPSVKRYTQSL